MSVIQIALYCYCIGSILFLVGSTLHIYNLNQQLEKQKETVIASNKTAETIAEFTAKYPLPKGWIVADCGQSLLHYLWYILIVDADTYLRDKENHKRIGMEEFDSFEEAYLTVRKEAFIAVQEQPTKVKYPVQLEFDFDFSPKEEFKKGNDL